VAGGAGAAAGDVADPAAVAARQVPRVVGVVAADRRRVAVSTHPAARHAASHVRAPDRCTRQSRTINQIHTATSVESPGESAALRGDDCATCSVLVNF